MRQVPDRITELRALMRAEGLDAYLVPSADPHNSEYVPECWKRRAFISGFTGSAGDVVIAMGEAGLWTDGRYFLQAENQLEGTGISLFRDGDSGVPKIEDWLAEKLAGGGTLGVDPRVLSMETAKRLDQALSGRGATIKYLDHNLVDAIWESQPPRAATPLEMMPLERAGRGIDEKLEMVRQRMAQAQCRIHVLGGLDAIAWLFNLRSSDIAYSRMLIAYAVVTDCSAHLFIDPERVTAAVRQHLGDSVEVHSYEAIANFVEAETVADGGWWIDPAFTNQWLGLRIGAGNRVHEARSPVSDLKAVKNPLEQSGFRVCHEGDGVAMVRFLKWLEAAVPEGGVTEISAAVKLEQFRALDPGFQGPSFPTIAGYAAHGAIIHYEATPETDSELKPEGLFLLDSGGHYCNGTTDITRTLALGLPTDEQRDVFTRVLKGVIGLSTLRFPKGLSGKQLEFPARKALWDSGRNFNHGTGHGVGHSLNVHEGPIGFSHRSDVPLQAGNVLSVEPGHYEEGSYAIRIENLVIVQEAKSLAAGGWPDFLGFETITLCPIDLNLIDRDLLTEKETDWLNAYHRQVFAQLSEKLDEAHRNWLRSKTREI